jgi:hypothetical protein
LRQRQADPDAEGVADDRSRSMQWPKARFSK